MFSLPFDIYPWIRPIFFCMDPENAHHIALECLKRGLIPKTAMPKEDILQTTVCGLNFTHPIGLAAGFDKHAEVIDKAFDLGFSSVELGGVTPLPQPGNPLPRLFRIPSAEAVINRFGFNSVGADVFMRRLVAYHDTRTRSAPRILGINLGKNRETENAADDYVKGVEKFAQHADFLTVNVSSPNTVGLRDMQGREALRDILQRVIEARTASGFTPRLFLKIAPDLSPAQAEDIAEVALTSGIDAIIVGNTTTSRPPSVPANIAKETGGLSGKPLFELSTKILGDIYRLTGGKIPLIGSGGIFTGADAYTKIRAGASLLQIYSVLVYKGPNAAGPIARELAALLKRDGYTSIASAVGADIK